MHTQTDMIKNLIVLLLLVEGNKIDGVTLTLGAHVPQERNKHVWIIILQRAAKEWNIMNILWY